MHGPCVPDLRNTPRLIDGKCTKHFPKPFCQQTTIDDDGYPIYRRRRNNSYVLKAKTKLDNRFVVPYNHYLLLRYEAHINVEWCNRSRAIKYLFKYQIRVPIEQPSSYMKTLHWTVRLRLKKSLTLTRSGTT
jgi:hypothetical protein